MELIFFMNHYLLSHSNLNTPPNALAFIPGGNTQGIGWPPCLASDASLANPWNFPLSFTENIKITFLYLWKKIKYKNGWWVVIKEAPPFLLHVNVFFTNTIKYNTY